MPHFISEFAAAARSPLPYLIWAALTVVLTVSGPFATYDLLAWSDRALYWALVVALSITVGKLVRLSVERLAGRLPLVARMLLVCLGVALALAPLIWLLSRHMVGPTVPPPATFIYFVFVIAVGVQVVRLVLAMAHRPPHRAAAAAGAVPGPPQPRLLGRLAPDLRGTILRVSARNHYLEVQTDRGQADLLLRFSDGLAELEGLDGARVHRSHWVAWPSVAAGWRDGNRLFLRMQDGTEVPVSRRNEGMLRDRGLI